ncbi:conserved hypothetical protein, putative membrane protein [Heliomicrobium modesticaldum Ice1]|uniref:DUF1405 domain-containing protein n=1 Tax=Heliobacterium modesticaldum (strain ATCC 51547 / Ice1) TaxID=498761 RepID=B0TG61_HELMI|nr:DUF1405 domain-containing protein [Heliomicrobium modesticaldum]ABZ84557.1 conserved hypothetical protein, putative membrane protein [Heliomicrobium modesticaldum Ice1]
MIETMTETMTKRRKWQDHPLVSWLFSSTAMTALVIVNLVGTLYGFWWYRMQLTETPLRYWPLVPDSPLASGDFTLLLTLLLLGIRWPWLECLAPVVLVKYGLWAVIINVDAALTAGPAFENWLLGLSHLGMALQALLFWPRLRYSRRVWAAVTAWVFFNDFADYRWDIYPYLFDPGQYDLALTSAVLLSVLSLGLGAYFASSFSGMGLGEPSARVNQLSRIGVSASSDKIQSPK